MVAEKIVMTPWGAGDSLRDRMLRPGPGTPHEEVLANQRERLFGAMVASVAERGYAATRVGDLIKLSGVSSRTFYDLFPNKLACFVAAMEAVVDAAVTFTGAASAQSGSWEERAQRGFDQFAAMIALQPAAARMCLVDAYAAGPEAIAVLERASASFEQLTQAMLAQSTERAAMPPALVTAHIGAVQEIARTRLYRREETEVPGLVSEIWDLILAYRPPPAPLRLTVRTPMSPPESLHAYDHAERALRALAAVIAEQGYANTTIDQVVKRASMSTRTFYGYFDGKEDAFLAALDSGGAQMVAAMGPAFRRAPDWASGIRAGFGTLFNYLASRPDFARLMAVEVYAAGPEAVKRRADAVHPLWAMLGKEVNRRSNVPPIAAEGIAGAVYTLVYRAIRDSGPQGLPGLAPICTYIALAPFIGAEEACDIANGDGRGKRRVQARE
jgi:AcrR family transcriptional regulator